MQVYGFDMDTGELGDIGPALRPLADSPDPLAAAEGRMLLDLVEHLHRSGPGPRLVGHVRDGELELAVWPADGAHEAWVTVRPDCYDYDRRGGDRPLHYRVNVKPSLHSLSTDVRTTEPDRVERVIREAFGWGE